MKTKAPHSRIRRWTSNSSRVLAFACLFTGAHAYATLYYVSPTGSDAAQGTIDKPYASLGKAGAVALAGDTVYFRGGTYASGNAGASFTKSGTSNTNRICYWAYPGEKPVFDFPRGGGGSGIGVTGSWLHFKGFELNRGSIGINNAHDDILELINSHGCNGTGISVLHGTGGHLFLNCDSHDNYDSISKDTPGENADGFGVHYQTSGTSTVIRGCRSWWNSDDGYDFINQEVPVLIENSYAMGSGNIFYGTGRAGNGNGFKIGSSKTGIRHIVRNNVAWMCKASGFYANHSSGGNDWYNNTSYQNGTQYNMLASTWSEPNGKGTRTDGVTLTGSKAHVMRNNIGYPNDNTYMNGVDSKFNTWDLSIVPAANDFQSVTDPSLTVTGQTLATIPGALGPRSADGGMPNVDFLKLAAGSRMIDKGTDVQLPFLGKAPDLGGLEYGATTGIATEFSLTPSNTRQDMNDLRNVRYFDLTGRPLDLGALGHARGPVLCKASMQDGSIRTFLTVHLH